MPKRESIQEKLSRIRPPRVHIKYDVDIGNAIEMKELPFVVGVLADLSGKPDQPLPRLKDRKFVEIDRDNFDQVMKSITPRLNFRVEDRLCAPGDENRDAQLNIDIRFQSLAEFEPDQLVQKIPELKALVDARAGLYDLLTKIYNNEELGDMLHDVLQNTDDRRKLSAELGVKEEEANA